MNSLSLQSIFATAALVVTTGLYERDADFFFGTLPDPGVDHDGNSLSDSWELQDFNTLGKNPPADPDGPRLPIFARLHHRFGDVQTTHHEPDRQKSPTKSIVRHP